MYTLTVSRKFITRRTVFKIPLFKILFRFLILFFKILINFLCMSAEGFTIKGPYMSEECIQDVQLWMVANKLKLNGDMTELLVLTARQRPQPPLDSIKIGADIIKASKSAKNIGVWLDRVLSMDVQINNICKTAFSTFVT